MTRCLAARTRPRRVYAGVFEGWMGYRDTRKLLSGNFETFPIFG